VSRKVGNGNTTRFWLDKWVGEEPLKDKFPRLFSISNRIEAWVSDMKMWWIRVFVAGTWDGGVTYLFGKRTFSTNFWS
jgi:hypothetical protein